MNRIVRGSGFLANIIKHGKKLIKSKNAKKFISTARKELKKKKNQKIILSAANRVLDKIDGGADSVHRRRRKRRI